MDITQIRDRQMGPRRALPQSLTSAQNQEPNKIAVGATVSCGSLPCSRGNQRSLLPGPVVSLLLGGLGCLTSL